MGRVRGLLLKQRVNVVFGLGLRRRCSPISVYHQLFDLSRGIRVRVEPFSSLVKWTRRLRMRAKAFLHPAGRERIRGEQEQVLGKPDPIPKGHMAVYVGGDFQRIWVPVAYCNHPLFGELLRESENVYGFDHRGGIIIPCPISEFEQVQSRINKVPSTRNN